MRNKVTSTSLRTLWFSCVFLSFFSISEAHDEWYHENVEFFSDFSNEDFEDSNNYDKRIRLNARQNLQNNKVKDNYAEKIKPHRMPSTHPAKEALDLIFTRSRPTKSLDDMVDAGFEIISVRPYSFAVIARHPDLPGYLQKVYLDTEKRKKNGKEGWEWLVQRCEGANNIRKLIKDKKLKYFSVPDKWIYTLPNNSRQVAKKAGQPCILLVTDMELVDQEASFEAWKTVITKDHLDELYIILSHGYASSHVGWNIPYSKSGKFTCIDTEYAKRSPNYLEVENYLADDMKEYWRKLVKNGEKNSKK